MKNLAYLRQFEEEISSIEGEEQEKEPEDEVVVTRVQYIGEGEGDALEEDSDDSP